MPVWIVQSSLQKLTNPPFCLWRRSLGVHSVDIIWESKVTSYLFWVHPSSEHSSAARISVTGLQRGILLTLQTDSNLTEIDRADVGQSKYRSWPHKKHSTTHTYTHSFYHCSVSCFFPVPQTEEEKSVLFFFLPHAILRVSPHTISTFIVFFHQQRKDTQNLITRSVKFLSSCIFPSYAEFFSVYNLSASLMMAALSLQSCL